MNSLDSEPIAGLLKKLFAHSEETFAEFRRGSAGSGLGPSSDSSNYIEFFSRLKDVPLPVSPETGRLLYLLTRSMGATSVIEFGTSFGISTLFLAAAVKDLGQGRIISTEFEPSKIARARANFEAAGVSDLVEIREGDALKTLASHLPDSIDLVLLDGAKSLYIPILKLLEPRLRTGALVVADNADMCVDYVAHVRAAKRDYAGVPFGTDVEISMKL